jgi:putative addiction module component (TIGR02574 family)
MAVSYEEAYALAMRLPVEERLRLVQQLEESIPAPATAEYDAAWRDEVARRRAAVESGAMALKEGDAVAAELRRIVGK